MVLQWKRYASDKRRDHTARAATSRADDLDIDFALLGDPKADEPHGDSFWGKIGTHPPVSVELLKSMKHVVEWGCSENNTVTIVKDPSYSGIYFLATFKRAVAKTKWWL
jgi:hypothetical protein